MLELISHTPEPLELVRRAIHQCVSPEGVLPNSSKAYAAVIRSCIVKGHESVLEHITFTFRASDVSRVLTHQLVRHRIASYSQLSQRYSSVEGGFVVPGLIQKKPKARKLFMEAMKKAYETYLQLQALGIRKEDARYALPEAWCTQVIFTMNMRSIRNFLKLRMDESAQWEIRELAYEMFQLLYDKFPVFVEDLNDDPNFVGDSNKGDDNG